MRYLRKYESYFDVDQAIVEIGKEFGQDSVNAMIAKESDEWSDSYADLGNGEAEEQVIEHLISWYEKSTGRKLEESQRASLEDAIRSHFEIL